MCEVRLWRLLGEVGGGGLICELKVSDADVQGRDFNILSAQRAADQSGIKHAVTCKGTAPP